MKKNEFIAILAVVIVGIFLFAPGLFKKEAVYTPNIGPAGVSANSIVNNYYYPATTDSTWACSVVPQVTFKTTNTNYLQTEDIYYTSTCGNNLDRYSPASSKSVYVGQNCDGEFNVGKRVASFSNPTGMSVGGYTGTGNITIYNTNKEYHAAPVGTTGDLTVCQMYGTGSTGLMLIVFYNKATGTVPPTKTGAANERALCNDQSTKDPKYVCEGSTIKYKNCDGSYNNIELTTTTSLLCDRGCDQGGVSAEIVKQLYPSSDIQPGELAMHCSGTYQPSRSVCSNDKKWLFKTNELGEAIVPDEPCPVTCIDGKCKICDAGYSKCAVGGRGKLYCNTALNDYTIYEACPGDSVCEVDLKQDGTPANTVSCKSSYTVGQTACGENIGLTPNQPYIRNADFTWGLYGSICNYGCIGIGSCRNQCEEVGRSYCDQGHLSVCMTNTSSPYNFGNYKQKYPTNSNGLCLHACKNETDCANPNAPNTARCDGLDLHTYVYDGSPDYALAGHVRETVTPCANGCDTETKKCKLYPGCTANTKGKWVCDQSDNTKLIQCDFDQGYTKIGTKDCKVELGPQGTCDKDNPINFEYHCTTPTGDCVKNNNRVCDVSTGKLKKCDQYGYWGDVVSDCNDQGCTATGFPSDANSQCNGGCTGAKKYKDGAVYECKDGLLGAQLYNCSGTKASNEDGTGCYSECDPNAKKCEGSYSILCRYNSGSYQYLWNTTGKTYCSQGCNDATGLCTGTGVYDNFICVNPGNELGGLIYHTDPQGAIQEATLKDCGSQPKSGGMDAYCTNSVNAAWEHDNNCIYCSKDEFLCIDKQLWQCTNPLDATVKGSLKNCEVGCRLNPNKCDNLNILIGNKNFQDTGKNNTDIVASVTLTGSDSGNAVDGVPVTFEISGPNIKTQSASSETDISGIVEISFGYLPMGNYDAKLKIPVYNKEQSFIIKVTNNYLISLTGSQVLTKIPGLTGSHPTTELKISKDSSYPSDAKVSTKPEGLTYAVVSKKSGSTGTFNLAVDGEAGTYTIGIQCKDNQGNWLEEQTVDVQLKQASLDVAIVAPTSAKTGSNSYDLTVKGPTTYTGTMADINPTSLSVTISFNGKDETVSATNLGAGRYNFNYNFANEGTYTIKVLAKKTGYDDGEATSVIQISSDGTATVPGSGNNEAAKGITIPSTIFGINSWIIIGLGAVAVWYFFLRKKK